MAVIKDKALIMAYLKGEKGDSGVAPHIGANGNWWVGETDTGVSASGGGGGGGTTVTVNGEAVETFDADTKLNKITNKASYNRVYAVDYNGESQIAYSVSPLTINNGVVQRQNNRQIKVELEPVAGSDATSKQFVENTSKYYMHEIMVAKEDNDNDFTGNIVLQILSRQPNMYTSLADMVADTTLIMPTVAYWNYTGDKMVALTPSITETSIIWTEANSGGYTKNISTTDNGYQFIDTVKPYEIP